MRTKKLKEGKAEKSFEERWYDFVEIISLVRASPKEMTAQEIGKQLLRVGTSIAVNYEEVS